jgi:UDP-3-O-[3-hydroxymyristoyl] glucosamine N-acyltransferase
MEAASALVNCAYESFKQAPVETIGTVACVIALAALTRGRSLAATEGKLASGLGVTTAKLAKNSAGLVDNLGGAAGPMPALAAMAGKHAGVTAEKTAILRATNPGAPAERWLRQPNIHETARVHPTASVPLSAKIGPRTTVDKHVRIGERTSVGTNVEVQAHTRIGNDVLMGDGAKLGEHVTVHDRARLEAGAMADDYSIVGEGSLLKRSASLDQQVVLEDNVEIGMRAYIGKGSFIGRGTEVGNNCSFGPATTIGEGAEIGNKVTLTSMEAVQTPRGLFPLTTPLHNARALGTVIGDKVVIGDYVRIAASNIDDFAGVGQNGIIFPRSIIRTGAVIGDNVRLGPDAIAGAHSTISAGSNLQAWVVIGERANLGKSVLVRKGVHVLPGRRLSPYAVV